MRAVDEKQDISLLRPNRAHVHGDRGCEAAELSREARKKIYPLKAGSALVISHALQLKAQKSRQR